MKAKAQIGPVRCAIYTRKSTEEGLEQAFNSLDAQREACEAYAVSQRHEGWQVSGTHYDDGGFSGGNLNRPALQRLMADIKAGLVDLVVVYKIDRLTRSLMDFSKLVEVLEEHQTSFVSVTQHFNTTSSMGRLTLNVLLSFAQFEREVTGERIRDKIAASKRKGMWMGGTPPLGYAVVDKQLVVHEQEAALVNHLFNRYCALGCVRNLKRELDEAGTHGRIRLQRDGTTKSVPFSRGCLYALLKQRLYRGEVHQGGEWYAGQHAAIVPIELWETAQTKLESNRRERRLGTNTKNASLLMGMVIDEIGRHLMATHTTKGGKRYRYYLVREGEPQQPEARRLCLPAHDLERIATEQWIQLLTAVDLDIRLSIEDMGDSAALRDSANRLAKRWSTLANPKQREILLAARFKVLVNDRRVEVSVVPEQLTALLLKATNTTGIPKVGKARRIANAVEANLVKTAGETRILEAETSVGATALTPGHRILLKAIAQGRVWAKTIAAGEVSSAEEISQKSGLSAAHVARGLKCMSIPPDLIARLVEGKGPADLTWAAIRPLGGETWESAIKRWQVT